VTKAYGILSDLGIQDAANKMPSELSGGMRKRVAIARSLIISPDILLYDEPTAELDPINTKIISQIIDKLRNTNTITQVVVTHDIAFAYSIADKISILEDGKIILTGDRDAIKNSKNALLEPI
jgi:phospholipid/cholesterol/gamma-HCH transport system ATP-binding protein